MRTDPWKDLERPSASDALTARRIDENNPWDFFWARDIQGKCLLILGHHLDPGAIGEMPRLKGIEVTSAPADPDGRSVLMFRLLDGAQVDIFHTLCIDVVGSTTRAADEPEAVRVALGRTWRWHYLLRGGADGRLSTEAQKGLIGELLVLEHILLPRFAAHDAVEGWHGPLGAPKDFEVRRISIEAKARRGAATPFIAISNEFQLDDEGVDALFLYVVELDQAPSDGDGVTLSEVASRLFADIGRTDPSAAEAFEARLCAAGFRWEDDYSDSRWLEGDTHLYSVSDGFPRIVAKQAAGGVSNVKYAVSLPDCEGFIVNEDALESAWGSGHDVD